jgi:glycosyltransferase involved in cell wall biosynthesis
MTQRVVALLGRQDEPTDAVEEYCRYLAGALQARDYDMALVRVPWAERGWSPALRELDRRAVDWCGQWVCVQYTALAWSARGFPFRFLDVLKVLRRARARVAVVYHDVEPHTGSRAVDKLRRAVQLHVMRESLGRADLGIFTVPLSSIGWLGTSHRNATFIPVGANLPPAPPANDKRFHAAREVLRVAVFGITGGEPGRNEAERIVQAVRFAASKIAKLELRAFGRHADDYQEQLRKGLRDAGVDVQVRGVLPADEVVAELTSSDVLLFVRGRISTRRGSAIAGIACGLPVVAEAGTESLGPIEEAGVVKVDGPGDFAEALLRVLADKNYRAQLAARSRVAHEKYFSWQAIADSHVEQFERSTRASCN